MCALRRPGYTHDCYHKSFGCILCQMIRPRVFKFSGESEAQNPEQGTLYSWFTQRCGSVCLAVVQVDAAGRWSGEGLPPTAKQGFRCSCV